MTSLYFTSKIVGDERPITSLTSCHSKFPLVATAWSSKIVLITTDDGERLAVVTGTSTATAIAWHPTLRILAIGWRDGFLTLWQDMNNPNVPFRPNENSTNNEGTSIRAPIHDSLAVVCICWSTGGNLLLTSSKSCAIGIWSLESGASSGAASAKSEAEMEASSMRYRFVMSWSSKSEMPIAYVTHLSERTERIDRSVIPFGDAEDVDFCCEEGDDEPLFAIVLRSDNNNTVYVLDESQRVVPMITHDDITSIAGILWDCQTRKLLSVSTSGHLIVHHISDELNVTAQTGRKKIPSTSNTLRVCWAPGNVAAISSGESTLYIFDMNNDHMYALPLPGEVDMNTETSEPKGTSTGQPIITTMVSYSSTESNHSSLRVTSSKSKNILAVGTNTGKVVLLQYTGIKQATGENYKAVLVKKTQTVADEQELDNEQMWSHLSTLDVEGGSVETIRVLSTGSLAVVTATCVSVLQEALRRRCFNNTLSLIQATAETVVVSSSANASQFGSSGSAYSTCNIVINNCTRVREAAICSPYVALWNGVELSIYTINENSGTSVRISNIPYSSSVFALHHDGIFKMKNLYTISFDNFQNQNLATLSFTDSEGSPRLIDCCGDFICVVTNSFKSFMKVARVGNRSLRQVGPTRALFHHSPNVMVSQCRVNPRGKMVALILTSSGPLTNASKDLTGRVYVYDLDTDKEKYYDFLPAHQMPESVFWNTPTNIDNSSDPMGMGGMGGAPSIGSSPTDLGQLESLLLAVETRSLMSKPKNKEINDSSYVCQGASIENMMTHARMVNTLFVAQGVQAMKVPHQDCSSGVVLHNTAILEKDQVCLLGCSVPYIMFSAKFPGTMGNKSADTINMNPSELRLQRTKLRDFQGMGPQAETDLKLRDVLMKFGYYTTLGNMDEAYRAIKSVKDVNVWQNLAKLCVTTRRSDVAEVCLANMQDGVAARSLRESIIEPEEESRLGLLALSLGMKKEAVELFNKANRSDLITKLLIASNKWDEAQAHTELHDHIRIFSVAYQRAQHSEQMNEGIMTTIDLYEKAQCCGTDVPRILMANNKIDDLKKRVAVAKNRLEEINKREGYSMKSGGSVNKSHNPYSDNPKSTYCETEEINANRNARDLVLWWAQYLESMSDINGALQYYEISRDVFNVVRILCILSPPQVEEAITIVSNPANSKHVGAAYFIGRYYEDQGNIRFALQYLNMSGAIRRAVRLSKISEMYTDVVSIVLQSTDKPLAIECAKYFDERSMYDRAAQLYQKGGDTQRAIDVCIKGGLFEQLHQISEQLDSVGDPETFIAMSEHFINSKHYEKAVQMLVFAKAYHEALQLCQDKDVRLTDEMAETMTLPKGATPEEEEYRMKLLLKTAAVAKDQGSYHMACKKYTQAGERVKALKMLLKAGDTEKVIFFANHSRNPEIYVLAANFLQSQKWQTDPVIYKTIVQFYTKAKSFESLTLFYDSCAQLQIDEYRDYDKAIVTLKEAQKILEKAGDSVSASKKANFGERIKVVELFVNARTSIKPGQECPETVKACKDLLLRSQSGHMDHALIDSAIRVGDVYALLVEYYEKLGQYENSYNSIKQMRGQDIELSYFLEGGLVEKVCKKVGKDPAPLLAPVGGSSTNNFAGNEDYQEENDILPLESYEEEVI